MANYDKKIINEIAQELDCGNDCYFNPKTKEIIAIPNYSIISDEALFEEVFGPDVEKVNEQEADFIKLEVLQSFESFKIMERFVEQIDDQLFKAKLENALHRRKPFRNFKYLIDDSDFRQDWFDFKQNELEKRVENELKHGEF